MIEISYAWFAAVSVVACLVGVTAGFVLAFHVAGYICEQMESDDFVEIDDE